MYLESWVVNARAMTKTDMLLNNKGNHHLACFKEIIVNFLLSSEVSVHIAKMLRPRKTASMLP